MKPIDIVKKIPEGIEVVILLNGNIISLTKNHQELIDYCRLYYSDKHVTEITPRSTKSIALTIE